MVRNGLIVLFVQHHPTFIIMSSNFVLSPTVGYGENDLLLSNYTLSERVGDGTTILFFSNFDMAAFGFVFCFTFFMILKFTSSSYSSNGAEIVLDKKNTTHPTLSDNIL